MPVTTIVLSVGFITVAGSVLNAWIQHAVQSPATSVMAATSNDLLTHTVQTPTTHAHCEHNLRVRLAIYMSSHPGNVLWLWRNEREVQYTQSYSSNKAHLWDTEADWEWGWNEGRDETVDNGQSVDRKTGGVSEFLNGTSPQIKGHIIICAVRPCRTCFVGQIIKAIRINKSCSGC